MEKNEKRILSTTGQWLFLLLLAGLVACGGESEVAETEGNEVVADEGATVETWDNNRFNSEFASTIYFDDWDMNDDNMLDENEYTESIYETWDVNNDNRIVEDEWNTAMRDWGLENQTWGEWDTTGDGFLDDNEFRTAMARTNWYGNWDTDGDRLISEREYTDGVFGIWDENNNNVLDQSEYRRFYLYYGD